MLIELAILTGAVSVGRAAWRRMRPTPTVVTAHADGLPSAGAPAADTPEDPPNPHRVDVAVSAGAVVLAGLGHAVRSTPLGLASVPLTLWSSRQQFTDAHQALVVERRTSFALVDGGLTIIAFATGSFIVAAGNTLLHTMALALTAHESARNRRAAARPAPLGDQAWISGPRSTIHLPADRRLEGHTLELRPGDIVPADGRIVDGAVRLDARIPAGRLGARDQGPGDAVADGNRIIAGRARFVADAAAERTTRRRLARAERPVPDLEPSGRRVDRIADASVGFTLPTALMAGIFGGAPTTVAVLGSNLFGSYRVCGPAALQMHLAALDDAGIEVPDGRAFERLAGADRLCIELTALLDPRRLEFTGLRVGPHVDGETCLAWAAALIGAAGSPTGDALAEAVAGPDHRSPTVLGRRDDGDGVESGWIDGHLVELGPSRALLARGVVRDPGFDRDREAAARTRLAMAIDGREVALLGFEHALRPGAEALFDGLTALGIEPMLLTVEPPDVGDRWARRLGTDTCWSALGGPRRAELVEVLQAGSRAVAYLGAGPLDRAAMAIAHVTLAAPPVDASARAAADIVLRAPLSRLPDLVRSARRYHRQQGRTIALMAAGTGVIGFSTLVFGLAPLTALSLQFLGLGAGLGLARPERESLMALPTIAPSRADAPDDAPVDTVYGPLVPVPG